VFSAPAAFAGRVRCRDIDAAMNAGKTPAQIVDELGTTATRIEACHRIALNRAQHDETRAEQRQRHAEREALRD
jgi:uncharacterized protein (DUF433 family)